VALTVVLVGAPLGWSELPTGAAVAATLASTKAAVAALESQVAAQAGRMHQATLAYQQDALEAADLAEQVSQAEQVLSADRASVAAARSALVSDALAGYMGATDPAPVAGSWSLASVESPAIRQGYLDIAEGRLADTLDHFQAEIRLESQAEADLQRRQKAAAAAAASEAAAQAQALGEASALQSELSDEQAELASLIQAEARAAQAAAQPPPAPPATGLPLSAGLVQVVKSIVATPPPPPAPATDPPSADPPSTGGGAGGVWLALRECESGDNYAENTGNGFYGAYQFSQQTWTDLGYPGRPDLEPPAMQDQAAMKLQAEAGWGQWPACSAALGLR